MINIDVIKHQMNKMDISSYYLWKLTGIGYATINGLLNGDRQLETVQVKNYERIVNTLFTHTERTLAEKSEWGVKQYEAYYKQALIQAIKSDDVLINRSGAVSHNENNDPQSVPVHIRIEWGFVDDKTISKTTRENAVGYHLHDLRIFDNDLYNKLNNTGQKDKKKIVEKYINGME